MKRIVLIGSGNVAEALARAVAANDELELVQLFARNPQRGPVVAAIGSTEWTCDPAQLARADLYLLAVSDKAVKTLSAALPIPVTAVVAHTAGSVPLDALPAKYPRRAVVYPFQTFTAGRVVDLSAVPFFVEASSESLRSEIEIFARKLSRQVVCLDSARRAKVHLAGVFANNFANHMFAIGERLVHGAGLDFEVLKPLIAETAAKAVDAVSPADVQTGPAVRNDFTTKVRHAEMLASDLNLKTIYSTISQSIWETSKKI